MANKPHLRLNNSMDVSRLLARTINKLMRGEIQPNVAGKIGYLGNILLNSFAQGDLLKRIERLEEAMKQMKMEGGKSNGKS